MMEPVWCGICQVKHSLELARKHMHNDPLGREYGATLHDTARYDRECKKEAIDEISRSPLPRL